MKNLNHRADKKNLISRYSNNENNQKLKQRSTDVNVLLNRVKLKQKNEIIKKLYFSVAASTGLILFGLIIF